MLKVFNFEYLRTISTTRSLQMHSSWGRKQTKPIHIRSTKKYLVLSVDIGKLPRDLFTHSSWEQDFLNFLKFWNAQTNKPKKLLQIFFGDIQDLNISKKVLFQQMRNAGISLGWTVVRLPYPEILWG